MIGLQRMKGRDVIGLQSMRGQGYDRAAKDEMTGIG